MYIYKYIHDFLSFLHKFFLNKKIIHSFKIFKLSTFSNLATRVANLPKMSPCEIF